VPLEEYDSIKLGYAVTTHKSQGMTTQNTFILTDEAMQDRELSYVQASRARGTTRLFTTKTEAGLELSNLAKAMSLSHQKALAMSMELLEKKRQEISRDVSVSADVGQSVSI
jgi:ATP-dependent exoDNAse (exonuclease V) alpha subunit